MAVKKVAILTAGGLAPCLSSAIGALIEAYDRVAKGVEIICYKDGYKGLLLGDKYVVDAEVRAKAHLLHRYGGSPIGNSRVKLTNVEDCLKRALIKEGQDPQEVAADQLIKDGVDVLHTIGGDDTNTAAAELAKYMEKNKEGYNLTVVGLPKTIDNDVYPIRQTLGAWTAAEQGARFFENVVAEHSANPRMLIVHEVMGRNCGWLTAYTARIYRSRLNRKEFLPSIGLTRERREVHGIFVPEMGFDISSEAERLRRVMDEHDCVNIFVSEGAGVESIAAEMESRGEKLPRDPFGHIKLDAVNVGAWFGKQFGTMIGAQKTLVQKSGYFCRSAAPNAKDLELIRRCCEKAVECALAGVSGVVGEDEKAKGELRAIEFDRVKGGKPFDIDTRWFLDLLLDIGQKVGPKVAVKRTEE